MKTTRLMHVPFMFSYREDESSWSARAARAMRQTMTDAAFDPATLDFYAREAAVYTASGPDGISRHLPAFLARLPPGARILELGCGAGRDSAHMIEQGFDLDPTDGVDAMARQAAQRVGRPVRLLRFDELDIDRGYDAVWASASLLHVPRAALGDVLGRIWRALKPGGWHGATYKGGGTEGRDAHGRYYNYPDAPTLRALHRAAAPWSDLETEEYPGGSYGGAPSPWVSILARRPADRSEV